MTRMSLVGVGLVAVLAGVGLSAQSLSVELQRIAQQATVTGDLRAAIEGYQQIVARAGADRAIAAQALLRMAACYEKLGASEARTVYERVVREYADQKEAVVAAQARLGGAVRAEPQKSLTLRKVWDGRAAGMTAVGLTSVSDDGRLPYWPFEKHMLALHDLAGGADRPLTVGSNCDGVPVISRDGTLVAYNTYGSGYCGHGAELRLVSVHGSGVPASRLLFENADVESITPMDISPDNRSIVITLARRDGSKQIGLVATETGAMRVLKSVDWRGPTRMFFSPDGRDLAFDLPANDTSNQRDVFVLAVDGSREIPAVVHPGNDVVMGWAPDGTQLLFASDRRSGAMALWAQAFQDRRPQGAPVLVTESINSDWSMGVTSTGALYLGVAVSDRDIAVVSIDVATGRQTGSPARPIQSFFGTNFEPAWSPDGKSLAYVSWRGYRPISGDPRILAIRSVDTGDTRELRPNLAYFDQLSWAPDGRALVTGGIDVKARSAVFRVDSRTGDVTTIVPLPQGFETSFPQWSPDGTRIYYRFPLKEGVRSEGLTGRNVTFMERTLASGQEREVARGDLGGISLSPDGRWIAAHKADPSSAQSQTVVLIPVQGGETKELFRSSEPIQPWDDMPWTPDGRGVLVRRGIAPGEQELWFVPMAEGLPRKLDVDMNGWVPGNWGVISLHPDGRQIAFTTGKKTAEVWVLENFLPALSAKSAAGKR